MQMPVSVRTRLAELTERRGLRVDYQHKTPDRGVIDVGLTASALTFSDGGRGYLFAFQDVTDMRRLEREARLRQRLAAVGEMAAGIAHEIRNPLASMSGSIQVLRHELPLSEEQAQLMDIVLRESERLNHTITSFLAYARPQRAAIARLDVGKVLQDTALLLRNSADLHDDHVIDVNAPDAVWCEADENQVRQIVWNLATNGLRAMATGGRLLLSVRSAEESGNHVVVLAVQDQGCGIPADEVDSIFQPFRSSFERGTGLGLAIVHRLVSDYNGTIDVSSEVGVGTIFTVKLPAHAGLSSTPAADEMSAQRSAAV
jgi:two-component system sensor histidine kinase PilS (NtrC family)